MAGNVDKGSDLDIIEGSTGILLIGPHGIKEKLRDDISKVKNTTAPEVKI